MKKQFKTIYDHLNPVSPHGGDSLTDQQYLQECDINSILKTYGATGKLPVNIKSGVSGDFSEVGDFQSCLDKINRAKDEFASLPAEIRARFGNDPVTYVDFVLDPANTEECVRLGLKEKFVKKPSVEELLADIKNNTTKVDSSSVTATKVAESAA